MWIATPAAGFFSIVQKPEDPDGRICIRARVPADLDVLRERYLPSLTETVLGKGTDYPARAWADREAVAQAMASIVRDLSYGNVKLEVARVQGYERARVYGRAWSAFLDLERLD